MEPPERVRVTGPVRRRPATTRAGEIDTDSPIGEVYLRSLLREQGRLAVRVLATLFLTVGSLPLAFHFFPGLAAVRVVGVPLPWLVLGLLVYPYLLFLGWFYVRRAEENEGDFTELVTGRDRRPAEDPP